MFNDYFTEQSSLDDRNANLPADLDNPVPIFFLISQPKHMLGNSKEPSQ